MEYTRTSAHRAVLQIAVIAAMGSALADAASAQTAIAAQPQAAAPQAAAAPKAKIEEVIVTAQRRRQRLKDVPISVVSLSGTTLSRQGITNIRDLTAAVPGLVYTAQGPFAEPNLRGVTTELTGAAADSPIAVYVDGIYQANQIGNLFDLTDISRVEVAKGPQGTLFGRNATGGAISIYTLSPSFTRSGNFEVSDGAYFGDNVHSSNHTQDSLFLTGGLYENILAGSIAASFDDSSGYLTNDQTGGGTGSIESYNVRGKLLYEPNEDLKFLLTGYIGRRFDGAGASVEPLGGVTVAGLYPGAIVPTEPWHVASENANGVSVSNTQNRGVSLRTDWTIDGVGTFTNLAGYTFVDGYVAAEVDGAYSPACVRAFVCITPYVVDYGPTETEQEELTFNSRDFGPVNFLAGFFYFHDLSAIDTQVNPPLFGGKPTGATAPFYTVAMVDDTAYAGFGEVNYNVTPRLHLIGGIRYSWEQEIGTGGVDTYNITDFGGRPVFTSVTPRASIRYDVTPSSDVYFTYSKGFKSGVLNSVNVTNAVAQPERLDAYEVGYKYSQNGTALNLAAFYYDYHDLQVQFFEGFGTTIGNAPAAHMAGLDLDGSIPLTDELTVRAAGSWLPLANYTNFTNGVDFVGPLTAGGLQQIVVNANGDRMLRTPTFTGNLSLNYLHNLPQGTLDATGSLYYSTAYPWDLTQNVRTGDYLTLNGEVGYTFPTVPLRVALYAHNLTNKAYVTATTLSVEGYTGAYAPPREVGLKLRYSF